MILNYTIFFYLILPLFGYYLIFIYYLTTCPVYYNQNIFVQFVAHPNIQQLLASIWYEGVPGFRRKTAMEKIMIICRVALLFPFYCTLYMIAPNCGTGKLMRKPFMKFLIHASSYLFFLRKCCLNSSLYIFFICDGLAFDSTLNNSVSILLNTLL